MGLRVSGRMWQMTWVLACVGTQGLITPPQGPTHTGNLPGLKTMQCSQACLHCSSETEQGAVTHTA